MKKVIDILVAITLFFYATYAYHFITPESWAWLTKEQLSGVMAFGSATALVALYYMHKERQKNG